MVCTILVGVLNSNCWEALDGLIMPFLYICNSSVRSRRFPEMVTYALLAIYK